jgi:DNA topoisomerase-1
MGRFGPYVVYQGPKAEGEKAKPKPVYASLKDPDDLFVIGMNRAVELIEAKIAGGGRGRGAAAAPLRMVGEHPDGGEIALHDGKYGPYVKWGKVNATLPKERKPDDLTLAEAIDLVNAKAPKKRKAPAKKAAGAKSGAAKKPAAKKAPARKTASKKAGGKASDAAG